MIPLNVSIEFNDTTRAWNDWKHGNIIPNSSVRERYNLSLIECTKMYGNYNPTDRIFTSRSSLDVPDLVKNAPERNDHCHICRKSRDQLYPCRICGKVYHQQCVQDIGETKSSQWIKSAHHLIGWSCPMCEDLRVLLPTDELEETNEWIKSLGTQTMFNLDNYLNNRLKSTSSLHFSQLTNQMKIIFKTFLHTIPDLTSNRLSQPDLFLIDLCLKIIRTPAENLVHFLTPWELYRLSQLFLSFSSFDQQYLHYQKFDQTFHRYLRRTRPEMNFNDEQFHLEALTYTFFGRSMQCRRTWSQFLLDTTIPTLLKRLNHRTSLDFTNRIVSTKRSTSPSPDNYRNGQSIAKLIRNVLEKLTQTVHKPDERRQRRRKQVSDHRSWHHHHHHK